MVFAKRVNVAAQKSLSLTLSASHPIQPQDTLFQTLDMDKEGARG